MEAGGAAGVAVLLWVTEKCKQTMLGKDSCAPVWKSGNIAQASHVEWSLTFFVWCNPTALSDELKYLIINCQLQSTRPG